MSVAVISSGRSGTNMVLEILAGNDQLAPSGVSEDQDLCRRNETYPDNYLTKCDTVYMNYSLLEHTLNINPSMKIIWTVRDPRDWALSKIYRGQPKDVGGDCSCLADDATFRGCLQSLSDMLHIYKKLLSSKPDRVLLVKMEDVINDLEGQTRRMCDFIGISFQENMLNFYNRMRNSHKANRYSGLDRNEVHKYPHWRTIYNGFFARNGYNMDSFFKSLEPYIKYFNYE